MNYNLVKDAMEKVKNGSLELISGDVSFKDVSNSFKETNYMLSLNGVDVLMFQKNGDIINIDNTNSNNTKEDINACKSIFYNVFHGALIQNISNSYEYMNKIIEDADTDETLMYEWFGVGLPDGYEPLKENGLNNEEDYESIREAFENLCENHNIKYDENKIVDINNVFYIKESLFSEENTKENLASLIDDFMYDYDTYEYNDRVNTRDDGFFDTLQLLNEKPEEILRTLNEIKENEKAEENVDVEVLGKIEGLIDKVKKVCNITEENNELDKRLKDKENRIEEERVKIHNKDDYNKLSDFANKLDKTALNELQNILIQCEYDKNVLSDFTSAVDDMVVNKNLEGNQLHNGTYMMYDTKLGDFYDISVVDKNDTLQVSFEKFINFIEEHKDNHLVMIQAREPSFKKFEKWEESIINNLFNVAKANNVHLMDCLVVNVDGIRKNGMGEYNFKGLINKNCYSYKYNTLPNVKLHINKLEVNETMKQNQGLYANTEIKTETNTMKASK